jgi:hypothetical protein
VSPLRLNWCATCGGGHNFGDQLGPILLRHYGIPVVWASPATAEIITVGSILSKVPNGWTGTVLGTGFIRRGMCKDLSRARVLAVRGVLTRKACGLPASVPLGDLGLLVSDLPRFAMLSIGALVVPHTVDHDIAARHPGATVVRATAEPAHILSAIAAARIVYTSSLHALIAADALGVPHVLEPHPGVHGGMFKFTDYASALGQRITPYVERLSPRAALLDRQQELRYLVGTLR